MTIGYRLKYLQKTLTVHSTTPGGIRTHDPRFRKPVLYPTELRALMLATIYAKKSYRKPYQAVNVTTNADLACFLAFYFLLHSEILRESPRIVNRELT